MFTVHFRTPIKNSAGVTVGAVGVIVDMNYLSELVDSITAYAGGRAELYAANGTIMASHDKSVIGRRFQEAKIDRIGEAGARLIEESLASNQPVLLDHEGLMIQSYPFRIGTALTSWALVSSAPVSQVLAEVNDMMRFVIAAAVVSVLVSAGIGFLIAYKIARPIVTVSQTLRDISEGEGDLTRNINLKTKSELGELAHYFNRMLEKIRNLVVVIKKQAAYLFNIGSELSANMSQTAAAVNEITANIQSIKSNVTTQAASVTEAGSVMEQITLNIDQLSALVENQSASVAKSSTAIEEMIANIQSVTQTLVKNTTNVEHLAEASDMGRTSLQEVAGDIKEIARESEGLLEINALMENIASQTNLLSMNAAIEAAHAGDAGKGFAVVADEIRKLAETSGEQSKTIGLVLKKIRESIDKITNSTENALNKFEAIDSGVKIVAEQESNIRNAMEEQGEGTKQILEAISHLNEITGKVRDSSSEMLEESREVIQESKNLESVTQEISGGMNEMAAGAEEINTAVNEVNNISDQNKESIDTLVQEVSRFKVE